MTPATISFGVSVGPDSNSRRASCRSRGPSPRIRPDVDDHEDVTGVVPSLHASSVSAGGRGPENSIRAWWRSPPTVPELTAVSTWRSASGGARASEAPPASPRGGPAHPGPARPGWWRWEARAPPGRGPCAPRHLRSPPFAPRRSCRSLRAPRAPSPEQPAGRGAEARREEDAGGEEVEVVGAGRLCHRLDQAEEAAHWNMPVMVASSGHQRVDQSMNGTTWAPPTGAGCDRHHLRDPPRVGAHRHHAVRHVRRASSTEWVTRTAVRVETAGSRRRSATWSGGRRRTWTRRARRGGHPRVLAEGARDAHALAHAAQGLAGIGASVAAEPHEALRLAQPLDRRDPARFQGGPTSTPPALTTGGGAHLLEDEAAAGWGRSRDGLRCALRRRRPG